MHLPGRSIAIVATAGFVLLLVLGAFGVFALPNVSDFIADVTGIRQSTIKTLLDPVSGKIQLKLLPTGHGHGLDADTVDGQHASSFALKADFDAATADLSKKIGDLSASSSAGFLASGATAADSAKLSGQLPGYYLNASNLNAGTLSSSRLSSNVDLIDLAQTFTSLKTFSAGLTVSSGAVTLPAGSIGDAALSTNVALLTGSQTFSGAKTFSALLTASNGFTLSAGALTLPAGSVADSYLTTNVALLGGTQTFTGAKTFSAALIGPTSTNTINGLVINSGALSAITSLTASGSITFSGLTTSGVVTNTSAGLLGTLAGTTTTVLHGNASGLPTFGQIVGGDLASNISISTSGNIATTGTGTVTSAGAFTGPTATNTLNGLIVSSGALSAITNLTASGSIAFSGLSTSGVVTNTSGGVLGTLAGTTTTVLHGNAAGLPAFGQLVGGDLAANISVSTSGNIATTGTGTVTSAGLLTASSGISSGGNLTFSTDNLNDIGAVGATRPRDVSLARNLYVGTGTAPISGDARFGLSGTQTAWAAGLGLRTGLGIGGYYGVATYDGAVEVGRTGFGFLTGPGYVFSIFGPGDTTERYRFTNTGFMFPTDNTLDIGASGATRPRTEYLGTALAIGTNPASNGHIRLPNNTFIRWRNAANTADIDAVYVNLGDNLHLGAGGTSNVVIDNGLLFNSDNVNDIGASGANRPRTGWFGTSLRVNTAQNTYPVEVGGATGNGIRWTDTQATPVQTFLGSLSTPAGLIGTLSNHPLIFFANNAEKMRLSASGGLSLGDSVDPGATYFRWGAGKFVGNANGFGIAMGTADSTEYQLFGYNSGSGNGGETFQQSILGVSTTDVSIHEFVGFTRLALIWVVGKDATTPANEFADLIVGTLDGVTVLRTGNNGGTPPARVYTSSGNSRVFLHMAAAANMTVHVLVTKMDKPF